MASVTISSYEPVLTALIKCDLNNFSAESDFRVQSVTSECGVCLPRLSA